MRSWGSTEGRRALLQRGKGPGHAGGGWQEEGEASSLLRVLLECYEQRSDDAYGVQAQDWPPGDWAGGEVRCGPALKNLTF